ncbi:MAG TPA: tRNA uridine-5-carboxymethylaminomethyl(34) synthesis GTPase MnmE [Spirochaetota bacterium]|nr:tRNA uridine-5-carboxymethylaminomethyl(34) synthesis GTPase MnmE [Spirochaetota bacterium]
MVMIEDTICAPATPPVNSPIAILRLSGPETFRAVASLFSRPDQLAHRRAVYGSILDGRSIVDDAVVLAYRGPASFTGEDMAEIFCHGNPLIVNRIMTLLRARGVRVAAPGEFSSRAFQNGKIDLTEAEAINHIITARGEWEIEASIRQMHGSLARAICEIRERLVVLKADIECGIDFAEEDIEFVDNDSALEGLDSIRELVEGVHRQCRIGERISRGIDLPIVGRPNVGKSSVLNLLLNTERAIVSAIPGTTRDTISESIRIAGMHVNLIDTAGIDVPSCEIEKMGVELSLAKIEASSMLVVVVDVSVGIFPEDRRVLAATAAKKRVLLLNKADLVDEAALSRLRVELGGEGLAFSAKTGRGLKEFEATIAASLAEDFADQKDFFVADVRMTGLLEEALGSIGRAAGLLSTGEPREIVAFELQSLLDILASVTGAVTPDDVLNSIFSRFCIGK